MSSILRATAAIIGFGVFAAAASADPWIRTPGGTRPDDMTVAPMVGMSAHHGLEAGAKADFLLANPGFIPMLNNSVSLEASVFVAQRHGVFVAPNLRWDFHLHPQWTVFGVGGIEANLASDDKEEDVALVLAAGAFWRVPGKSFLIRGEIDAAHAAARIGPVFPL